mgnify:CR=1 FL=1
MSVKLLKDKTEILIIAAGASVRLGSPKQLLPWGKTTLLGNTVELALNTGIKNINLVLGAHFEEVKASVSNYKLNIHYHASWQQGMGSSIAFGVTQILQQQRNTEAIIILLADQPLIDSAFINRLLECNAQYPQQIIATSYGNRFGVPAIFPNFFFTDLIGLKGDTGAREVLNNLNTPIIAVDGENKLTDIDTLGDYQKLKSRTQRPGI